MTMDSSYGDGGSLRRVSPFRNPWINEYLLLTTAYRSLSRLSSALSAKAFTLCSLSLDLFAFRSAYSSAFCSAMPLPALSSTAAVALTTTSVSSSHPKTFPSQTALR